MTETNGDTATELADRAGTQAKHAAQNTGRAAKVAAEDAAEKVEEVAQDVARKLDGKLAAEFGLLVSLTVGVGTLTAIKGVQLFKGRTVV